MTFTDSADAVLEGGRRPMRGSQIVRDAQWIVGLWSSTPVPPVESLCTQLIHPASVSSVERPEAVAQTVRDSGTNNGCNSNNNDDSRNCNTNSDSSDGCGDSIDENNTSSHPGRELKRRLIYTSPR